MLDQGRSEMVYGVPDQLTEPDPGSDSASVYSSRTTEASLVSWMEATRCLESVASLISNSRSGITLAFWLGILLGVEMGVFF